jgi:hypothetical protein
VIKPAVGALLQLPAGARDQIASLILRPKFVDPLPKMSFLISIGRGEIFNRRVHPQTRAKLWLQGA